MIMSGIYQKVGKPLATGFIYFTNKDIKIFSWKSQSDEGRLKTNLTE